MADSFLIDTNVLLRMTNPAMRLHELCRTAVLRLHENGSSLHFTLQNASEYWNVSTRPREHNGHGLDTQRALLDWHDVEQLMTLLPDDARVYSTWRVLVVEHKVQGIQVHDAKLAAAMMAHSVRHILTLNTADFARYANVQAVHPSLL